MEVRRAAQGALSHQSNVFKPLVERRTQVRFRRLRRFVFAGRGDKTVIVVAFQLRQVNLRPFEFAFGPMMSL